MTLHELVFSCKLKLETICPISIKNSSLLFAKLLHPFAFIHFTNINRTIPSNSKRVGPDKFSRAFAVTTKNIETGSVWIQGQPPCSIRKKLLSSRDSVLPPRALFGYQFHAELLHQLELVHSEK
jgi:hypothetical protein